MKYRLNYLDSSYNSDRFMESRLGMSFESMVGINYDQRYLILDEGQAIILRLNFPTIVIRRVWTVEETHEV